MTSRRTELLSIFVKTAADITDREFATVAESTPLSELGIDSLGMLEIVGSMERELKVQLPDEALIDIVTIQDLLKVVEEKERVAAAQPVERRTP
jgi:acyl carrier protein